MLLQITYLKQRTTSVAVFKGLIKYRSCQKAPLLLRSRLQYFAMDEKRVFISSNTLDGSSNGDMVRPIIKYLPRAMGD